MWNIKEVGSQSGTMALAEAFRRGVGELRCDSIAMPWECSRDSKNIQIWPRFQGIIALFKASSSKYSIWFFFRTIFFRTVQVGSPRTALEPLCTTRESAQLLIWLYFIFRLRAQRLSQKQRSLFAFSVHERNSSNMKKKNTEQQQTCYTGCNQRGDPTQAQSLEIFPWFLVSAAAARELAKIVMWKECSEWVRHAAS